ncbi:MAG: nucleotidyltransferase family protein [Gammaproteobacteria bacterium]|nr:nucleotidyltransferase family protein [Gammaproteobacteria bacterium]
MHLRESLHSKSSPDIDLLISCLYSSGTKTVDSIVGLKNKSIDWRQAQKIAIEQMMGPHLFFYLRTLPKNLITEESLEYLQSHFHRNIQASFFMKRMMMHLLSSLKKGKVTAIPFLGNALLLSEINSITPLQVTKSLDLLIKQQDFCHAQKVLRGLGFHIKSGLRNIKIALNQNQMDAIGYWQCAVEFENRFQHQVVLHLEFPRYYPQRFRAENLWTEYDKRTIKKKDKWQINPEYRLLILCIEGGIRCWKRLGWIHNLALFIRNNSPIDWEQVVSLATELRCCKMLRVGLLLVYNMLNEEPQRNIKKIIKDDTKARSLALMVYRQFGTYSWLWKFRSYLFSYKIKDDFFDSIFSFSNLRPEVCDIYRMTLKRSFLYFFVALCRIMGDFWDHIYSTLPPKWTGTLDYLLKPTLRKVLVEPFNGQRYRRQIFKELLHQLPLEAIVETGTFRGATTEYILQSTTLPVYSVELDARFFYYAKRRLRSQKRINLTLGDSRDFLEMLANNSQVPKQNVFFYLDAHWNDDLPLREEVALISRFWKDSVIMIDDFEVPGDIGYQYDNYGQENALRMEYLTTLPGFDWTAFFPSMHSSCETGMKRGCVVLAQSESVASRMMSFNYLCLYCPEHYQSDKKKLWDDFFQTVMGGITFNDFYK